jgi:hypothetical protein
MKKQLTISDLTPEIKARIPEYIERYTKGIDNGERYNNFKLKNAEALINWNYEKCGFKKPVVIVCENIYESQIFFNFIVANKNKYFPILYLIYSLKNNLNENIEKFIENIKSGDLKDNTLNSTLRSTLYSTLDSTLESTLRSTLRSTLDSTLRSTLYSTLYSTLGSTLDSTLRSTLDSTLYSTLRSTLGKYNEDYLFTTNIYTNVLLAWFKFSADNFDIYDEKINLELNSWNDLYLNSNVYSAIFSELFCVVSKYPKHIYRDGNDNLHNVDINKSNGLAVEWGYTIEETRFDCYYIHGRNMPKVIFEKHKNNTLTKADFINETNEDIRGGIYEIIEGQGEGMMMKFLEAVEVDRKTIQHEHGSEELILYKTEELFNEEEDLNGKSPAALAWLKMTCPSTGQNYLIPSDSSFNNCVNAAKYHRPNQVPKDIEYFWNSRN